MARVFVRTLQEAFQRELGTTPLEQLRRIRLNLVHRDLLSDDPTTTTLTEVATRCDFFHLGRFSRAYRECYGE